MRRRLMNTLDAIFSRRSIRTFTGNITEEELRTVLKAAYAAPVGRAMYENVHLTVITNRELLDKIDSNAASLFYNPEKPHPLFNAPAYILVSAKLSGSNDNVAFSNCACIVQNMVLAAVELGLGVCHIWGATAALNQNAELLKELNLPEGFTPCCGIVVGQTAEVYTKRDIPDGRIQTDFIR